MTDNDTRGIEVGPCIVDIAAGTRGRPTYHGGAAYPAKDTVTVYGGKKPHRRQ